MFHSYERVPNGLRKGGGAFLGAIVEVSCDKWRVTKSMNIQVEMMRWDSLMQTTWSPESHRECSLLRHWLALITKYCSSNMNSQKGYLTKKIPLIIKDKDYIKMSSLKNREKIYWRCRPIGLWYFNYQIYQSLLFEWPLTHSCTFLSCSTILKWFRPSLIIWDNWLIGSGPLYCFLVQALDDAFLLFIFYLQNTPFYVLTSPQGWDVSIHERSAFSLGDHVLHF